MRHSPKIVLAAAGLCAMAACTRTPRPDAAAVGGDSVLALVGGIVYPAPNAERIADGVVLISGQRIMAVGTRSEVRIPARAVVIDVGGQSVLPAFWNSHVHLTEPKWAGIDTMPAERASELLREMFTRFGFVRVFDIGSFPEVTTLLRQRIQNGEVLGPDILTTLLPFVPPNGTPRYVAPLKLPELDGPLVARDSVRMRIAEGADAIKIFTVPITRTEPFPVMAAGVVQAVTDEAHREGRPVFAHPTNLRGIRAAVYGGVDVLAHTAPVAGELPDSILLEMHGRHVALIPTLTLWEEDFGPDTVGLGQFVRAGQDQVLAYRQRGGRILFGTDVGYIAQYDPTREYELMAGAGLDFHAILSSLTSAPAEEFGAAIRTGRLAPGFDADIVVVNGDPATDIRILGRVRLTMKRGRVLYESGVGISR